jgi:hypothetical protein
VILWSIRLATLCYVIALAQFLRRRDPRLAWTLGCLFYLTHVAAAFHLQYHWSHAAAVQETARQTQALFGLYWGGGVWFNYAFTAIWTADTIWWNCAPKTHQARPAWLNIAVHSYLAFLFVNGAIVFPQGPIRGFALSAAIALAVAGFRR